MTKKPKESLLSSFLGDMVTVFLSNFDSEAQSEEGPITIPMVLQGILVDFDDNFILLGDNNDGQFSLVALSHIGKIDTVNENAEEFSDKPPKEGMN